MLAVGTALAVRKGANLGGTRSRSHYGHSAIFTRLLVLQNSLFR